MLTKIASSMYQKSGRSRDPRPSPNLRPCAQEAMTNVRISAAHTNVYARPTMPVGPIAEEPIAETKTVGAIIGPTAAATPPSTTTRVKPTKIRMASITVKKAAHSGKPDCHSQMVITATPESQVKTAVRL